MDEGSVYGSDHFIAPYAGKLRANSLGALRVHRIVWPG
jgi:hypothetical protein